MYFKKVPFLVEDRFNSISVAQVVQLAQWLTLRSVTTATLVRSLG